MYKAFLLGTGSGIWVAEVVPGYGSILAWLSEKEYIIFSIELCFFLCLITVNFKINNNENNTGRLYP